MTWKPNKIYENKKILKYLVSRGLLPQYLSVCKKVLSGDVGKVDLKKRKPTGSGIWSFRINKQFRVIGYRREDDLIVVKIHNHQ